MDLTAEHNKAKGLEKEKQKKAMVKAVGTLFQQFDSDKGGTLNDSEILKLLQECKMYEETLNTVGLSFDKLKLVCHVCDYDYSQRMYDPEDEQHYHHEHRPADASKVDFSRVWTSTSTEKIPEGRANNFYVGL
jgi:hypothetical protein